MVKEIPTGPSFEKFRNKERPRHLTSIKNKKKMLWEGPGKGRTRNVKKISTSRIVYRRTCAYVPEWEGLQCDVMSHRNTPDVTSLTCDYFQFG